MHTKERLLFLPLALLTLFLPVSCELETSSNGDLDGYWKLYSIDTVETDGHLDLTPQSIFWAVQNNLISLRDNNDVKRTEHTFRFQQTKDSLHLTQPHTYDKANGDKPVTELPTLTPYGITQLEEHYHIIHLSSRRMQIENNTVILKFRKF